MSVCWLSGFGRSINSLMKYGTNSWKQNIGDINPSLSHTLVVLPSFGRAYTRWSISSNGVPSTKSRMGPRLFFGLTPGWATHLSKFNTLPCSPCAETPMPWWLTSTLLETGWLSLEEACRVMKLRGWIIWCPSYILSIATILNVTRLSGPLIGQNAFLLGVSIDSSHTGVFVWGILKISGELNYLSR